jgi:hypothetical protein
MRSFVISTLALALTSTLTASPARAGGGYGGGDVVVQEQFLAPQYADAGCVVEQAAPVVVRQVIRQPVVIRQQFVRQRAAVGYAPVQQAPVFVQRQFVGGGYGAGAAFAPGGGSGGQVIRSRQRLTIRPARRGLFGRR